MSGDDPTERASLAALAARAMARKSAPPVPQPLASAKRRKGDDEEPALVKRPSVEDVAKLLKEQGVQAGGRREEPAKQVAEKVAAARTSVLEPASRIDAKPRAQVEEMARPRKQEVVHADPGMQVVAKTAAKFSAADLEELRKAIVVKGTGRVIKGFNLDDVKYNEEGLVPVIAQDRATGAVLMQAWANKEALEKALTTDQMTYWSRQRNKLWVKGEESGHQQKLVKLVLDCDKDTLLAIVVQDGPACHRDTGTCFVEDRNIPVAGFLGELDQIIASRAKDAPAGSYTAKLLDDPALAVGKVLEEAKEVAKVLRGEPDKDTLGHEAADLIYHLLVACRTQGVVLADIVAELHQRHGAAQKA